MTYAVIQTGGKQYQVNPGDTIEVELLGAEKTVTFTDVLLYVDGDKIEVGTPTVKGVTVTGEVVNSAKKGKKIRVFKFKHKSRYRKLRGHRQAHTLVKIISVGNSKAETASAANPVTKETAKKEAIKKTPRQKTSATATPRNSKGTKAKNASIKKAAAK